MNFRGTLTIDPSCFRVSDEEPDECGIQIGRRDVIEEIHNFDGDPVVVKVNGQVIARGVSLTETGCGYSECTPMDSDSWNVGSKSLFDLLKPFDGKVIELDISPDEFPALPIIEKLETKLFLASWFSDTLDCRPTTPLPAYGVETCWRTGTGVGDTIVFILIRSTSHTAIVAQVRPLWPKSKKWRYGEEIIAAAPAPQHFPYPAEWEFAQNMLKTIIK